MIIMLGDKFTAENRTRLRLQEPGTVPTGLMEQQKCIFHVSVRGKFMLAPINYLLEPEQPDY